MRRGYTDLADGQMFYREAGEGPPIVLVHQILRTSLDYRQIMSELSVSYRVVAFDLMGCGDSDTPPAQYSFEQQGAAIASAMESLGLSDAVIAGHHGGANIAMEVAVQRPELVRKLVMSGPSWIKDAATRGEYVEKAKGLTDPEFRADGTHLLEIWKEGLETNWGLPRIPAEKTDLVTEFFLEQIKTGPRRFDLYVSLFEYDPVPRFALLDKPSLIIYAANDVWMCRGETELAEIIPDVALHEIEGTGELPRLRPKEWAAAVRDFVRD